MNSQSESQIPFYKILEDNGWHNEDNQMYPPHGTFWISGNDSLSISMIERIRGNAKNTLQKISENSRFHFDGQIFQNWTKDLQSLIKVTSKIIETQPGK